MLILSLSLGLIASFFLTPVIAKLAIKYNVQDHPNARRLNKVPIPSLGGLAIYFSLLLVFLLQGMLIQYPGVIIGATLLVLLGIVDDVFELKPFFKLVGQLISCLVPILLEEVNYDFLIDFFAGYKIIGIIILLLWLVYLINSINFIDGLDGLAGGVAIITGLAIASLAYFNGQLSAFLFSTALVVAVAGFIPYNYHPATIFMGDTGSMLIGFILGISSLKAVAEINLLSGFILIIIFLLPVLDTLLVIAKRQLLGRPIFKADKSHLHHRLLKSGYQKKQVTFIIYLLNIFFAIFAMAFYFANFIQFVFLFLSLSTYFIIGFYNNKSVVN